MKRKKGGVSRFRRQKDDLLLRSYNRFKYEEVRVMVADEARCDLAEVRSRMGANKALREGLAHLRKWWSTLGSETMRKMMRDRLRAEMQMGQGAEYGEPIIDEAQP